MQKVAHVASQVFSDNIVSNITDVMHNKKEFSASGKTMGWSFAGKVSECLSRILRHSNRLKVSESGIIWVQDLIDVVARGNNRCHCTAYDIFYAVAR